MFAYPKLPGSYEENQQFLLAHFGLTDSSEAPFGQVFFFDGPATEETPHRSLSADSMLTITLSNEEKDSPWLLLALSVIARRYANSWPEMVRSCQWASDCWLLRLDDTDFSFLLKFFKEKWGTLCSHPVYQSISEKKVVYIANTFNTETKDGHKKFVTWIRWVTKELWEALAASPAEEISSETHAFKRTLHFVVNLLGNGELQIVNSDSENWSTEDWLLRAIFLTKNTPTVPSEIFSGMQSYTPGNDIIGPAGRGASSTRFVLGFDPFPSKFSSWGREGFIAHGLRVGFHTYVHPGAYIGKNVTIGHRVIIEAGAYVEDGATIKSGAYIGVGAYIGRNATIGTGAILTDAEPGQRPVVINDGTTLTDGTLRSPVKIHF